MEMKNDTLTIPKATLRPGSVYVKIEKLEVEKYDIEGDEGKEGNAWEEKMKEKWKEVVDISDEDEVLPIGVLLKKETIEVVVQNNV